MEASKGARTPLAVLLAVTLALGGSFSTVPLAYADPEPAATGDAASPQGEDGDSGSAEGSPEGTGAEGDGSQGGNAAEGSEDNGLQAGQDEGVLGDNVDGLNDDETIAAQGLSDEADEAELLAVSPTGDVVVSDIDELIDAVANAGESRTVSLSDAFVADMAGKNATVALNNQNGHDTVIDGGGKTLTSAGGTRFFSVTNPATGSVTFQNVSLSGAGAGVIANAVTGGKIVLDNVHITGHAANDSSGQAVGLSNGELEVKNSSITNGASAIAGTTGNVKTITVTDTVLNGNTGGYGAAVYPGANTTATVTRCTINNNTGTSGGYCGGAISIDQDSNVLLTVSQCYFEGNEAPPATGSGGSGGAIALYHSDKSKLIVKDSYFVGNKATANQTVRNDGGAISVFMNGAERSAEAVIENCVFENNVANDDAGALLIEGVSSGSASINVEVSVSNSTFIGNEGKQGSTGVAGGAVQVFSKARASFDNCTFYKNIAGNGAGGAIGLSGSLAGGWLPVRPTVAVENCAFVENTAAKGTNVSNVAGWGGSGASGFTNKGGNIGYDAGTALPAGFSAQTVFGTAAATLQANGCSTQVGSDPDVRLPSLYLAPAVDDTVGLYADGAATANATAQDARYVARNASAPDAGAVDIGWIKLHPNGGTWDDSVIGDYNSTRMLSHTDASGDVYAYVACDTGNDIALPGGAMFSATPTDKVLLGWGESATTQPGDADFHAIDEDVLGCEGAVCGVYYAVWGEDEPPLPPDPTSLNVARLFGVDRYGTSHQVSTYERAVADEDIVILASGNDNHFPDALTASSLSGHLDNAPIVLTDYASLTEDARQAIVDDLDAKHVIIIGDKYAVSENVEAELNAIPSIDVVERIGGVDRQETAEFIFEELGAAASKTAIIARCDDFPDSLTISPWAAVTKSTVFLSEFGLTDLTPETKAALASGGFDRILVLGDEFATPRSVYEQARDAAGLTDSEVIRIGGDDRYETAGMIADWATSSDRDPSEQLNWEKPAIARGDLHPDSLTGGALQGRDRSVILLTPPTEVGAEAHPRISAQDGTVTEIRFFGDEYAVALDVTKAFINALTYDTIVWKPSDAIAIDMS